MFPRVGSLVITAGTLILLSTPAVSQVERSRIVSQIDDNDLRRLPHNVHPLAQSRFDHGAAPPDLSLEHMQLLLTPSAAKQQALAQFLDSVHNPASPQYHHWLAPQQFGDTYGLDAADLDKVSAWLTGNGFQVTRVSNSKTVIEFSGSAAQVQNAFHTAIHQYVIGGVARWANSTDPQIPAALSPVVAGVASLFSFRKAPQISKTQAQISKAGPLFTGSDGQYALAPGDFATIYNVNPVYASGINGAGTTIAVVARSNIKPQDITDFRNAFSLATNPPRIIVNGTDPGLVSGDEEEAVLDTSWAGAIAPAATIKLIVSQSTNTTDGVDLSEEYIIDNNLADVMTESYGDCEADYTSTEAEFYASLSAQAAAEGITYTVAAGDSGAEGCDDPGSETVATGAISVNVLAATPNNVAVGGTQLNEAGNPGAFWSSLNGAGQSSALTYIPEDAWNESCTAASCGAANASIYAGSGGRSTVFAKPSWQTGVTGIPNDGVRDVPDVAFSSASHDFYLICLDGSCTERRGRAYFSGVSGTSAPTPSFAGVMALIVQYTGGRQGQPNYQLYSLAAAESLSACNASNTSALPSSGCIFHDVTSGNNAVPGEVGFGTSSAKYSATVGYDLATGLGSANVSNLVFSWNGGIPPSSGSTATQLSVYVDSPAAQNATVIGSTTFRGWALANNGLITNINIAIDSVPYGAATYGLSRSDVCAVYTSTNCPNVGWSFPFDTTLLADGSHTFAVSAQAANGQVYTTATTFTVANWTSSNPMLVYTDAPSANSTSFSGVAGFSGWAIDSLAAVSQVAIAVDGVSYGLAQYGLSRPDVCQVHPNFTGCPNVGWSFSLDTTQLPDGMHTLAVTPLTAGGQYGTTTSNFSVLNVPSNVITLSIDQPNSQNPSFGGVAGFGGWAIGTAQSIASIAVTIDGLPYGNAILGSSRADVCSLHPTAPGCPNVGWNFALDTTQISNGFHILGLKAYAATGQYVTATRMFTVSNAASASPVLLGIDSPSSENAIVIGTAAFRGWAISSSRVAQVAVAIDGVAYANATYGASRPDVCTVYPGEPDCPNVGWALSVDTTQLADGTHTMTVAATTAAGLTGALSSTFTVVNWTTSNPMKFSIDTPNSQSGPLSGIVSVGGWVFDTQAAISNVTIAVDGTSLGNAHYGITRNDVCAVFPGAAGCPNVGWNYLLDTTLFADGTHTLAITGITVGGQYSTYTGTFTVANATSTPIRMSIDTPSSSQTLFGIYPIGGWALDANGAAVTDVEVLVDGQQSGAAIYGSSRSDVCAHYTGAGGCPNVGWNYELNTTGFANGPHTLQVRAAAADGHQLTISTPFNIGNQP